MQYAWLELDGGLWRLLTDKPKGPVRIWVDEDTALKELKDEGWTITGPYPARPCGRFYGSCLSRNVH